MDPNATLAEIDQLIAELRDPAMADPARFVVICARLAELFDGLTEWLTRGGFPPAAWSRP